LKNKAPKRARRVYVVPILLIAAALIALAIFHKDSRPGVNVRIVARTPSAGGHGSTYFVDPATGQPREPTPQELLDLQQAGQLQQAAAPEPIVSATGFNGLRLGDDQMMYTVAKRNADGTVTVSHAEGKAAAEQQVKQATLQSTTGKEQPIVR